MFQVGQKVLCIDDRPAATSALRPNDFGVFTGNVYTVSGSRLASQSLIPSVNLEEVDPKYGAYAYRFRPIDDPFIEQFREMVRECEDFFSEI
jgi:hypothetical protein